LVEIAKALSQEARILVLDEPTAALADAEVETLFRIIEGLRARGVGMIYISHKLEEVFRVSERITVLRDGRTVGTQPAKELNEARVISLMVGRDVSDIFPKAEHERGEVVFEARGFTVEDPNVTGKLLVKDVGFKVRRGEVLGIAGLMGSGRSELARALFGIDRMTAGTVELRGKPVRIRRPKDAIENGIVLVPEDRRREGLVLMHSVRDNLTLTMLRRLSRGGMLDDGKLDDVARAEIERLDIKLRSMRSPVRRLSGGNQQKVVLSKWLATSPDVLILDEPTVGVDIATRTEIVELTRQLAAEGKGVIVISSELAELLALADRLIVLRDGRVDRKLDRSDVASEPELHRLVQEQAA
jgi:ABC-type sugar transport system ATPase subunit